uniref:CSON006030 protein n=1 Tax=Culicoides sonorensis TaxID=179676 RepID=A0A336K4I6_CULSO
MYSHILRSVRSQCCPSMSIVSENHHRLIHTSIPMYRKKNHYDVLEITPKATQQDIKNAYYKLSKMYHPDMNKDNVEAAEKFREVSASYEVLGNFKLRKLYDKGILHTASPQYAQQAAQEAAEDDPQTKFYKQRMRRTETPQAPGETPVYDFDEWTRNHYGSAFERRMKARMRHKWEMEKEEHKINSLKMDKLIYWMMLTIGLIVLFVPTSYDEPKPLPKVDR